MDKGPKDLSLTKIHVIRCYLLAYPANLQGGKNFLVISTAYITQINVKYHIGCVKMEIEPYNVQLCEGLDKEDEDRTDMMMS